MNHLTAKHIDEFIEHLFRSEYAAGTIEKYRRDIHSFVRWLGGAELQSESAAQWKAHLLKQGYAPVTINSMLVALNRFFKFHGREDCCAKELRIQRKMFRSAERELTKDEYLRLLETARGSGRTRLALIIETICATGIRVSEAKFITVEALRRGRADISLKGKIRTILIPAKLCRKLLKYAKRRRIASGEVFLTRGGRSISRKQIWSEMKALCRAAGVDASKVFPHNLRHLFAQMFYHVCGDIAKLADVLGHSSIETTRIYLISTGEEHARRLEQLGLVL